jgi:hypothetical protein
MKHSRLMSIAALIVGASLGVAANAADDSRKTIANTPKGAAIKGEARANSQVPAVQQGIQTSPGAPAAKSGGAAKARENLRGNLIGNPTNSQGIQISPGPPSAKSAPSVKQGLTAGQ